MMVVPKGPDEADVERAKMALLMRQGTILNMNLNPSESTNFFTQSATTNLGHLAQLDINRKVPRNVARKTSIICTIGPSSNSVETIIGLRKAGMNIVRLNFSHGSFEFHQSIIDNTRKSFEVQEGRMVAIALDTKGPEIRTGLNRDDAEIVVRAGGEILLTTDPQYAEACDATRIYVDYTNITRTLSVGSLVFIDDGLISIEVTEVGSDFLRGTVLNSGKIGSRKGVNLPNAKIDLPALTKRDIEALRWGVGNGIDMVFASFIRTAADVHEIRRTLGEDGHLVKIISKIENNEGVRNFDAILEASDGIMVARGDLGIEIPSEKVFIAQKMMISRCNIAGKPVICATQMLESMTTNPRPTRAEVSDVANAVLDGADCVMLSGETAKGTYPIEAVKMMHKICIEAELASFSAAFYNELRMTTTPSGTTETLACAAVNAALEQDVGAIFVLTSSGTTARLVSKYRPRCPIITITRTPAIGRPCHLYRGCYPLVYKSPAKDTSEWQEDVDDRINFGMAEAKKMGLLQTGNLVIAIQGWKGGHGHTNTMRLLTVP